MTRDAVHDLARHARDTVPSDRFCPPAGIEMMTLKSSGARRPEAALSGFMTRCGELAFPLRYIAGKRRSAATPGANGGSVVDRGSGPVGRELYDLRQQLGVLVRLADECIDARLERMTAMLLRTAR